MSEQAAADPAAGEFSAQVVAVSDDVVTVQTESALIKNEVVYICPQSSGGEERLKAEVLRVRGNRADVQVYEDTAGVAIGDPVAQTGELLSVELGPGLLRQVMSPPN